MTDAVALIDQLAGGGPVHLVGHDWGAGVAWALGAAHPDKVASLTALSVPHPAAFLGSFLTSSQGLRSWYMYAFQLPWLPERLLHRHGTRTLIALGRWPAQARRDTAQFPHPADLTGPLNWYRAMPLINPRAAWNPVRRPTQFVWSDADTAISRHAATRCARGVRDAVPVRDPAQRQPLDPRRGTRATHRADAAPPEPQPDSPEHRRCTPCPSATDIPT